MKHVNSWNAGPGPVRNRHAEVSSLRRGSITNPVRTTLVGGSA
jgi:hypothetical protein